MSVWVCVCVCVIYERRVLIHILSPSPACTLRVLKRAVFYHSSLCCQRAGRTHTHTHRLCITELMRAFTYYIHSQIPCPDVNICPCHTPTVFLIPDLLLVEGRTCLVCPNVCMYDIRWKLRPLAKEQDICFAWIAPPHLCTFDAPFSAPPLLKMSLNLCQLRFKVYFWPWKESHLKAHSGTVLEQIKQTQSAHGDRVIWSVEVLYVLSECKYSNTLIHTYTWKALCCSTCSGKLDTTLLI